ncbi:MAG: acyltransferase, partial [Bacteroidetes bacterium]|nr:acyltransferase [Bacteroidota bacterium]
MPLYSETFSGLQVFKIINDTSRNSSVDIFRSIAIISVVIFHFGLLPYGYLGVDLFFVISGLLVGGLLTKDFSKGNKINFFKFFLQRGFKIWPSYYFFIIAGSLIAWCFYHDNRADQIIPLWDIKRYLFFYQNYTGVPFHWSFDHVWSLCVEEHFYILLPIMFLFIQTFISKKHKVKTLFAFVILTIIAGIVFKNCSYFLTNGKDTYSATHNRIDALAWGVLLNLIITYLGNKIKSKKNLVATFLSGLFLFILTLIFTTYHNIIFDKIYFHSIIPIAFFLMLLGTHHIDFSKLKILRLIAYYSYNWYLWHPIFVFFIRDKIGLNVVGLILYLFITFAIAVGSTIFIEEPMSRPEIGLHELTCKQDA